MAEITITAANFDAELTRARQKEESGISAFLTQPISSRQAKENIRKAREALHGAILGGLFPIVSHKNALFLQQNVNGMRIDDEIVHAYEGLERAEGEALARALCRETARDIAPFVDGYYIMTPFQRVELVKNVIRDIRTEE